MRVNYVTDTSKWEKWQNDYRCGLILIMPPPEVSRLIDPLRSKYDPGAFYSCPTHISISDPLRLEMTQELDDEVTDILSRIDPFMLYYDKPIASRDHAGVAYPITPQEPIDDLKQKLHQAAIFEGQVGVAARDGDVRNDNPVAIRAADDRRVEIDGVFLDLSVGRCRADDALLWQVRKLQTQLVASSLAARNRCRYRHFREQRKTRNEVW